MMQRYSIDVRDTSWPQSLKVLVPFDSSSTVGELIKETAKRVARYGKTVNVDSCTLRLAGVNGPILDSFDTLSHVIVEEELFANFAAAAASDAASLSKHSKTDTTRSPSSSRGAIPVRIITPSVAKQMTKDPKALPVPAFSLGASATIQQLHNDAVRHLRNNPPDWLDVGSVLDLHIHELPISHACFESTLQDTGIATCLKDGVLTIYAVPRPATTLHQGQTAVRVGMNDLYAAGPHWQPEVAQSSRGVAMFLSSLRVFAHLHKGRGVQDEHRERIVYILDLLCSFPPAVRALHLLLQGKTISHSASAALSQAVYCILEDFGHKKLIKDNKTRLFEASRLLFGLISEKANQIKSVNLTVPVYGSLIQEMRLQALTDAPLVPVGASRAMPSAQALWQSDTSAAQLKLSLVSESKQAAVLFNPPADLFARTLPLHQVISPADVQDLHQLANLCGKAELSVVRPSLLSSVAPEYLTFDQLGHVAVFTGKAGCAEPGEDTVIFRPLHGEHTPNIGQVEQQLAPILQSHEKDGTNVFDVLGSAQTRALASPDEIVMFCVDCSASMSSATDLMGIDTTTPTLSRPDQSEIPALVYARVKLDDIKKTLSEQDFFDDVVGTIVDLPQVAKLRIAANMLTLIFDLKMDELNQVRDQPTFSTWHRQQQALRTDSLEYFAAGLKRFEQELIDMIVLRAMSLAPKKWTWGLGDRLPGQLEMKSLPDEVIAIPHTLRCPIKLDLIQDPVVAADDQVYGRQAISKWISIRRSSPLTGLELEHTELRQQHELAEQADKWLQAEDLVEPEERPLNKRRRTSPSANGVNFSSPTHHFSRALPPTTTLLDVYKVAFRGMRGRHDKFQLSCKGITLEPSSATLLSQGITPGSIITIKIADDTHTFYAKSSNLCLVKVYVSYDRPSFCYWIPKDTQDSFASLMVKYWRFCWVAQPWLAYKKQEIWTDLKGYGDNRIQGHIAENDELIQDHLHPSRALGSLQAEPLVKHKSNDDQTSSESEDEDDDDDDGDGQGNSRVLVLKVHVSEAQPHHDRERRLSRLEVLKQMFEAMVNRMIAYSYKTHIGLITFSSTTTVSQSITHVVENFRRSVQNMHAHGDTALWDGLKLAQTQIMEYAKKYPNAQRRIICLSDGNDTKSVAGPADLSWQLRQNKIAVDSVCIGNDENKDLRALSIMLNSYCFHPQDLTTALAICEMEPVLSQTERPPPKNAASGVQRTSALNNFYNMRARAAFTVVTQDVFPKRKEHPRLGDSFIELANRVRTNSGPTFSLPTLRVSRLLAEMSDMAANPHPKYDCYVSETDMFFWKVVVEGPPGTPYANCAFMLYLEMPDNFPAFPPKGRFVTPVFHPNINRHGRICHSIFDRDWTTDTTIKNVLDTVYGLLLQAEAGDAVHTTVTLGFHHDEIAFAEEARRFSNKHGRKTRDEWRFELLDMDDTD